MACANYAIFFLWSVDLFLYQNKSNESKIVKKAKKDLKVLFSIYVYPKASKESNFVAILKMDQIGLPPTVDHLPVI